MQSHTYKPIHASAELAHAHLRC